MDHPIRNPEGWSVSKLVYDAGGGGCAIALVERHGTTRLAVRWNEPLLGPGGAVVGTPLSGGATSWFVLPAELLGPVGRHLLLKKIAGGSGFDEAGLAALAEDLLDLEEIVDSFAF